LNHTKLGENILGKFAEVLKDVGVIEKKPKLEGRNMTMVVAPK
ncbi:MAG: translation initiation factor IF-3, partial [Ignavibacteriales bacterium]